MLTLISSGIIRWKQFQQKVSEFRNHSLIFPSVVEPDLRLNENFSFKTFCTKRTLQLWLDCLVDMDFLKFSGYSIKKHFLNSLWSWRHLWKDTKNENGCFVLFSSFYMFCKLRAFWRFSWPTFLVLSKSLPNIIFHSNGTRWQLQVCFGLWGEQQISSSRCDSKCDIIAWSKS